MKHSWHIRKIDKNIAVVAYSLYPKPHSRVVAGLVEVDILNFDVQCLEVEPKHRRKGYATALMKRVIQDFGNEELSIIVEPEDFYDDAISIRNLQQFYRSFGFRGRGIFMTRAPSSMVRANK